MLRIVITGAESSGKTTLARQLAAHFDLPFVSEYARIFFEKKQTAHYQQADLLEIAKGQLQLEKKVATQILNLKTQAPFLICDTDLLTIKIWSQEVFKSVSPKLLQLIENQKDRTLYLLAVPDGIAWEHDPLRENPYDRDRLFAVYEQELIFHKKNYQILRVGQNARLQAAIVAVTSVAVTPRDKHLD